MATRLVIELEVTDIRTGLWCSRCSLPSVIEADVVRLSPSGVGPFATVRRCSHGPHKADT